MIRLQSQSHLFCNFAFVHLYFTLSRSHDAFLSFCEATQQTLRPSFIFSNLLSPIIGHTHPTLSTVSSASRDAAETTHHPGFCGRAGVWTAAQLRDLHHGLGELRKPSSAHAKPTSQPLHGTAVTVNGLEALRLSASQWLFDIIVLVVHVTPGKKLGILLRVNPL